MAQAQSVALRPILAALNHVLQQQTWARDRLRTHAGRDVRIVLDGPLGVLALHCTISRDGLLEAAAPEAQDAPAAVTLNLKVSGSSLAALWSRGVEGLTGHLRIDGDVMVAAAVAEVARHLRWDLEEDLSRVVGDAHAHRLVQGAQAQLGTLRGLAERGLQAVVRQVSDDPQGVVDRSRMGALEARLNQMEASLDQLDQSLSKSA